MCWFPVLLLSSATDKKQANRYLAKERGQISHRMHADQSEHIAWICGRPITVWRSGDRGMGNYVQLQSTCAGSGTGNYIQLQDGRGIWPRQPPHRLGAILGQIQDIPSVSLACALHASRPIHHFHCFLICLTAYFSFHITSSSGCLCGLRP